MLIIFPLSGASSFHSVISIHSHPSRPTSNIICCLLLLLEETTLDFTEASIWASVISLLLDLLCNALSTLLGSNLLEGKDVHFSSWILSCLMTST